MRSCLTGCAKRHAGKESRCPSDQCSGKGSSSRQPASTPHLHEESTPFDHESIDHGDAPSGRILPGECTKCMIATRPCNKSKTLPRPEMHGTSSGYKHGFTRARITCALFCVAMDRQNTKTPYLEAPARCERPLDRPKYQGDGDIHILLRQRRETVRKPQHQIAFVHSEVQSTCVHRTMTTVGRRCREHLGKRQGYTYSSSSPTLAAKFDRNQIKCTTRPLPRARSHAQPFG